MELIRKALIELDAQCVTASAASSRSGAVVVGHDWTEPDQRAEWTAGEARVES
jgi:hypothetical protein